MLSETRLRNGHNEVIQMTGRYLMLTKGEQVQAVAVDRAVTLLRGYVFDFGESFSQVTITNESDCEDIELLSSDVPFAAGVDASRIALSGGELDRIKEPIKVTASATVENGTMHVISGANLSTNDDVTIEAGQAKRLSSLNSERKALLVQVISPSRTQLRLGDSTVSNGRGVVLAGSMSAPGSMPIETSGELWAFNESGEEATVSVMEVAK